MSKYVKVMFDTTSGANSDFNYKIGEVNISNNWNLSAQSGKDFGGFNFTTEDCIIRWLHRGDTVYDVEIPSDAEVVKVEGATTIYRSNKIIISNPRKVTDEMAYDFYKKSNIPNKAYYRTLGAVSLMGYKKTALQIFNDKINKNNVQEALEDFDSFIYHGGDNSRVNKSDVVKLIHDMLQNMFDNVKFN